jgi:7-carboxy-7-deazaguanine synthase
MNLNVNEIFYSLQGEGGRSGAPSLFVRLSGCSAKFACFASGVKCDTEFESGLEMTLEEILARLKWMSPACKWIVWTGGEPADQLTDEIVEWFASKDYQQAIETSGIRPIPKGLDWVTVSPKVAEHVIEKNFPEAVNELRYVRHAGQSIPKPSIGAEHYFVSPHFDGASPNRESIETCIKLCLENPQWKLSVQNHKLWNVR